MLDLALYDTCFFFLGSSFDEIVAVVHIVLYDNLTPSTFDIVQESALRRSVYVPCQSAVAVALSFHWQCCMSAGVMLQYFSQDFGLDSD